MQIAGYNVMSQDTFAHITNVKRYKGQTQTEYMGGNRSREKYNEFVENVQGVMSSNKSAIDLLSNTPFGGALNIYNSPTQASIEHIANSITKWGTVQNIISGQTDGRIVGWDLETVGKITSRTYDGYAGITELGILERVYQNGQLLEQPDSVRQALAIGFSDDQANALRALVRQFEDEGWDSLADPYQAPNTLSARQSTLQRLSMIGSIEKDGQIIPAEYKDRYRKKTIAQLNGQTFVTVRPLGPANFDPRTMYRAIELQQLAYQSGATAEAVLPAAIDYLTTAALEDSTALSGGNIKFDVAGLTNTAQRYGIDVNTQLLYNSTVDLVDGARAIATARTESVGALSDSLHRGIPINRNQAASVESQMETHQMGRQQVHFSLDDITNQLDFTTMSNYEDGRSFAETVVSASDSITRRQYDVQETLFFLNRGHIANDSADLVLVDGKPSMQTYPMANQYWTLGNHSGYVTVEDGYGETKEMYMLEFLSPVDDKVVAYKAYESEEAARESIIKNTTMMKQSSVTSSQITDEYQRHVLDEGRREFDRLFDPTAVTVNYRGEDEGGFARLQQYMQLKKELEEQGIVYNEDGSYRSADAELVRKIRDYEFAKDSNARVLKSQYQVEAFTGMLGKLHGEEELMDDIIKAVSSTKRTNGEKTLIAQKTRQTVLDSISVDTPYRSNTWGLSDLFGVDIQTPSGIHRVNAQTVDTATHMIDSALKGLSEQEIGAVITDLQKRQVISDEVAADLRQKLRTNYTLDGTYNFNRDLAYRLTEVLKPLEGLDNPLQFFSEIKAEGVEEKLLTKLAETPDEILHSKYPFLPADILAVSRKNLQSIAGNLIDSQSMYVNADGQTLSQLYRSNEQLNNVVARNVIEASGRLPIRYYDTVDSLDVALEAIRAKLGYNAQEIGLVRDLIGAPKDKAYTTYSVQHHQKQGLQVFFVNPEGSNKNVYMLLTDRDHSNSVVNLLTNGEVTDDQLDSYRHVKDIFGEHAAVVELHSVNRYEIGDLPKELETMFGSTKATFTTVNQSSRYEKFVTPMLDIYYSKGDMKVHGGIKTGVEGILTAIRLTQDKAIHKILDDHDFETASSIIRRSQNERFKDLTAPSSYRGHYVDGTIKRVTNYHPSDFLHAYEFNVEGLYSLMEQFVSTDDDNSVKQLLTLFNKQHQVVNVNPRKPISNTQLRHVLRSSTFKEFYVKNLFMDTISADASMSEIIRHSGNAEMYDKSIFEFLQTAIQDDATGLFDESVSKALDDFSASIPYINQVISESATKHHLIAYKRPGDFNVLAGVYSILRPTYTQQNRSRYLEIDDATKALLEEDGYTFVGQGSISRLEHDIKAAFTQDHDFTTPGGQPFDSQYRSLTTRFKQLSDLELQGKYAYIAENIDAVAEELGLDESKLRTTFEYMRNDLSTINEDKWFYDPLLGDQEFFRAPDAKRVTLFQDIEDINPTTTRARLTALRGRELTPGTVIGYTRHGKNIFYEGAATVLHDFNVDELLDDGYTYVLPHRSRINDVKLMIDSEKAMAHTIDVDSLLQYARGVIDSDGRGIYVDRSEAVRYAHELFQYVFDKSMVAGNMHAFKHNNNYATSSKWHTIVAAYQKAGKSAELVDLLTTNPELASHFADWNLGLGNHGEVVVDNSESTHLTSAVEELEYFIRHNDTMDETMKSVIVPVLDYQNENRIIMANLQQVLVNEHLSDSFKLDQRIEQGIRLRTWQPGMPVDDDLDIRYLRQLKADATSDTLGEAPGFLNPDLGAIQQAANIYNTQRLDKVRRYNAAVQDNRQSALGMMEALKYYANPEKFHPENKNILKVKISDLIKSHHVPKSGAHVSDFEKFLFFIDGEPSEWLDELAKQQNINLANGSYSLYVDLEQTVQYGDHKLRGVVIPIQNLSKDVHGDQFYKESQKITVSFLNDIIDITKAPHRKGQKTFNAAIQEFVERTSRQTAIMDKDSDMYKAYGRIELSHAGQYQAIDETPALTDSMMRGLTHVDQEQSLLERQRALQDLITSGVTDKKVLEEYDEISEAIQKVLNAAADEVRTATDSLPELTTLQSSPFKNLTTMTVDGKAYYNNLAALGEEGFRARGYDFGQVGMDLVNAYLNDDYSNIPTIANQKGFKVTDDEVDVVAKRLRRLLGIEDIDDKNLLVALNDYMTNTYGQTMSELSTATVNRAIVSGRLQEIFGTFEDIGKRYTREVGILAEALRYPSFGSQPMMNVVLDESIRGLGVRFFNPVTSTYTNVDFDGDTVFLKLLMQGGTFLKQDNELFRLALNVHERSIKFNNDLMAELIEKGASIKVDDLNDFAGITSQMLESYRSDKYSEAISAWAKNNGVSYRSIKDLTPAQILAARHSQEMAQAWSEAGLNTLLDKGLIRASLAVFTRKDNIGAISTPNVNLRTTIETLMRDPSLSLEQRTEYRNILYDLTNMDTSMRGLTGITEQRGIDVKHVFDGMNIASTPKWNIGLTQMFNSYRNLSEAGLTNLIKASNHVLFDNASDAEIKNIVADIMKTSREELAKRANESKEVLDIAKLYLRGVYDISLDKRAKDLFNLSIKKGYWTEDYMKMLLAEDIWKLQPGTFESAFEEALTRAHSDERIVLDKDTVYMRSGSLEGELRHTAWMQDVDASKDGRVVLREVSIEQGEKFLTPTGQTMPFGGKKVSNTKINQDISDFFHGHRDTLQANAYALRERPAVYDSLIQLTKQQTSIDTLNELLLTKDGKIRTHSKAKTIIDSLDSQQLALVGTDIPKWFDTKSAKRFYDDVKAVGDLYEYAIASEHMSRRPVEALIKQINADIVQHPENYGKKTEFRSYADVFRKYVIDELGGQAVMDRVVEKRKALGSLGTKEFAKAFDESLDFLNDKLYDIMKEESRLTESFDKIRTEVGGLNKEKVLDVKTKTTVGDRIKPLETLLESSDSTIKTTVESLRKANAQVVTEAQNRMYKLFQNTAQMDVQFGWSKVTGYSRVGFGEYMGVELRQLTKTDIKRIRDEIQAISTEERQKMPVLHQHAIAQTEMILDTYKSPLKNTFMSSPRKYKSAVEVDQVVQRNYATLTTVMDSFKGVIDDVRAPRPRPTTKKVSSEWFDSVKQIPLKTVGIGAAGLMALGVVNNILHNDKAQSPLTPTRRPDGNQAPAARNNSNGMSQAPMSQSRTVYHDNRSGMNFQVSAKTRNYIDDMNNAKLIGMAGGGDASVYSQSDMSGVTDNWLANKFAELT